MRLVPTPAATQFGVFTTGQALRSGWTSHALRHAVAHGYLDRLRAGVYGIPVQATGDPYADAITRLRRAAAAVSIANGRVPVSHLAAAALHGLELAHPATRVCATYPRGRRCLAGIHRHRGKIAPGDVVAYGPISLMSVARTVFDVGCEHGADAAVVCADSALRLGIVHQDELDAAATAGRGWPGSRAARRAIELADPRAESALESISRLRIVDAGLPMPRPQVPIFAPDGRYLGRVDFYWDEFGVVGEADGLGKLDLDRLALRAEKIRQGPMEDYGLIFTRWGWGDLDAFAAVAARIANACARGARPDRAPRRWIAGPSPARPRARAVS